MIISPTSDEIIYIEHTTYRITIKEDNGTPKVLLFNKKNALVTIINGWNTPTTYHARKDETHNRWDFVAPLPDGSSR